MWREEDKIRRREKYQNDSIYRNSINQNRREKYSSDVSHREKRQALKKERVSTPEGRVKENLLQRKSVAKKKNIIFSITLEDLLPLPTHCPILGIELDYTGPEDKKASPSIDKIIPELGYVPGNVVIISNRANTIKRDALIEEIILLADYLKGIKNA